MSVSVNPFVAGGSVGDTEAFAGRTEIVGEVEQGLRRPGRFVLVVEGPRGCGKTSLLDELARRLPSKGNFKCVRFDVEPRANHTLSRVVVDLAEAIATGSGLPRPQLGDWPEGVFADEWLPGVLTLMGEGGRLVLIFDEWDVIFEERRPEARATFLPFLARLADEFGDKIGIVLARGRNGDDRRSGVLRLFGNAPRRRVPPLTLRETRGLVRISEVNKSLFWSDTAAERVWELTGGHPYQIQHLCHRIWDLHHQGNQSGGHRVTVEDVNTAVLQTLVDAGDAFDWMWEGMDPASRVVAAALARQDGPVAVQDLPAVLHRIGVTVVTRTMEEAPHALRQGGLLEADTDELAFRGELFPRWIRKHKPLTAVQADLDLVDPRADECFRRALHRFREGPQRRQLEDTLRLVDVALDMNPNHAGATELKADVLMRQGEEDAALLLLERLATWQPAVARPKIVPILLHRAEAAADDGVRLLLLERLLEVAPGHIEAERAVHEIRLREARKIEKSGDLSRALSLFQAADATADIERISAITEQLEVDAALGRIHALEHQGDFDAALEEASHAQARMPGGPFAEHIRRLDRATRLAGLYQQGLGALQQGDQKAAAERLAEVIGIQYDYEEASRYLFQAVHGRDPTVPIAANNRGTTVPVWAFAATVLSTIGLGAALLLGPGFGGASPQVDTMALTTTPAATAAVATASPATAAPATAAPATAAPANAAPATAAPATPSPATAAPATAATTAGSPTSAGTAGTAPAPAIATAKASTPASTGVLPVAAIRAPAVTASAPASAKTKKQTPKAATKSRHRARNPTALVAQGWRQLDEGDLSMAQDTFNRATVMAPFDGSAWFGLGYANEERGHMDQAATHYCKALDRAGGEVALVREIQGRLRAISRGCR